MNLTAKFVSIGSKNSLLEQFDTIQILNLIEKSQFNKRKKKLFLLCDEIRIKLVSYFLELEDYFIIDSTSLEICKVSRHDRLKICKNDFETAPSKGFCASQNN